MKRHAVILSIALLGLCALAAAPAQATEKHVFDPTLSLRGNCSVSALDEVPDPGLCPGVPGVDHPPKAFAEPCDTAVDRHGDIYVASAATGNGQGTAGRIDVFNAEGEYLTGFKDEKSPCSIAVDSEGDVYVAENQGKNLVLFKPKSFPPVKGGEYEGPLIAREAIGLPFEKECTETPSIAIDPSDDHLYVGPVDCDGIDSRTEIILELSSAASGNSLLAEHDFTGVVDKIGYFAVDGKNHDIYASAVSTEAAEQQVPERINPKYARAFIFDGTDGHLKCEIDGSGTPQGGFGFPFADAGVSVDQANGDLYVDDVAHHGVVDQFGADCKYIGQLEHSFTGTLIYGAGLAVDDPFPGQVGYDSPNQGELYVAQGESVPNYHLYAFAPLLPPKAPEVRAQSVSSVTETEALLRAEVNPNGIETTYRFQYTTQAAFEEHGYEGAGEVPAPAASAGSDATFKAVSVPVSGLLPDTAYRFRALASNHCVQAEPEALCTTTGEGKAGEEGTDAAFSTYGPQAPLPDGRAYELVSPPDTGGLIPTNPSVGGTNAFHSPLVSRDGLSVTFGTEGGSLAGLESNGYHDRYQALRGPEGWQTSSASLSGAQASEAFPGGISADHRYSFWRVGPGTVPGGALAPGSYLRGPGGVEPISTGDLDAGGRWIGEDGRHIVFLSGGQVYERSAEGPAEVLSLLPGDLPPAAPADYQGTSPDASAVAFKINGNLYVRLDGAETQLVAAGSTAFGAVSTHGARIAYLRNPTRRPNPVETPQPVLGPPQGEIFTYDSETEETTQVGSGKEAVLVNVSPDGSHIYFLSPQLLDGEAGKAGAENLYGWDAGSGAIHFIATLTSRDVYGENHEAVLGALTDGLGLWTEYVPGPIGSVGPGSDPSRTSADGSALIFESRAPLGAYDNAGHSEIYRYDAISGALACISCNPTGVPASGDARLQSPPAAPRFSLPPVNDMFEVINLTPDGRRAFFQSAEPLVLGDTDGLTDVYEWEAPEKGSCSEASPAFQAQSEGCLYLISSGKSATDNYLYGMTPDGSDVVFLSGDLLVSQDRDKTPSLYDARVGGGFPPLSPPAGECLGEACQTPPVIPNDPAPASSSFQGAGNVTEKAARCPKGRHRITAKGKSHCAKRQGKKKKGQRKSHRASANRRNDR